MLFMGIFMFFLDSQARSQRLSEYGVRAYNSDTSICTGPNVDFHANKILLDYFVGSSYSEESLYQYS